MVNSLKRLNKPQIIGVIIEIISFIGCCFNIDAFKNWFWIGAGLNMIGTIYFIDAWGKEGKTWFKKLDKKRDKNLTRKSSELIFFLAKLNWSPSSILPSPNSYLIPVALTSSLFGINTLPSFSIQYQNLSASSSSS